MASLIARLFVPLQYLLPKFAITALVYRISRVRGTRFKNFLINRFAGLYKIDLGELARPAPDGFSSLNDFFTRELAAGARPVDASSASIVAPADGTVSAAGRIAGKQVIQAKGKSYSLHDLLSTNLAEADRFIDGSFATIYLAPYNYHRVHAPFAGELESAHYVPGDLFSVNAATVASVPGLFCRNERLILRFTTAVGPIVVVLVGALNVGSISTPWTGEIRPVARGAGGEVALSDTRARSVDKGELLGWFNMGSTVVVLLPPGAADWHDGFEAGTLCRVGESIGTLRDSP